MKKLLSLILALAMTLALVACGGGSATSSSGNAANTDNNNTSSDEVITVTVQFSFPEESGDGVKKVMAEIEEASNGRIKFEYFWNYGFVDAGDSIDALESNQLDIAGFMPSDFSSLPLNGRLCSLPLYNYPNWEAACKIWLSLVYSNEEMLAEYTDNGMVFWSGMMCAGYQYYSAKETTTTDPSVFNGMTVMCDSASMSEFINANSGGAQTCIPPEFLSNLQNGVCDALMQHVNCAYVFGCFDYTETALFFGEGGFYNLPLVYCFSEKFWNSLPEDLQAIFAEYADDWAKASYEADLALYENVALPTLKENAEIITLNDEQIAEWQAAIADLVAAHLDDITKDSSVAPEVYAQLKEMIANYDAETFEIGVNNFGLETEW